MKLAELLKLYRKWAEVSQQKLADEIGITIHALQKLEGGKLPDGDSLAKILFWLVRMPDTPIPAERKAAPEAAA